ncbi:MAG: hypothetical protein IH921_14650 [Gemmatimonadetes bacterium]|nr:hypothetical protein [Gemmatimonadota bacterium]
MVVHQIEAHFGDGSGMGVTMRYAREEEPLGTGGGLRRSLPDLEECFLLLYGDSFLPEDYRAIGGKLEAGDAEGDALQDNSRQLERALGTLEFIVSIDLEDTHFGSVDVDDAPTLTKNAITTVVVPVQFTWGGVGAGARALLTRGAVRYLVNTRVELDTPLGTRGVSTQLDGEVPLVELLRR